MCGHWAGRVRVVADAVHAQQHQGRRASVLLIVLVVVMLMSLGAYTFSELMVTEYEATHLYNRGASTRAFAESGIELAATLICDPEVTNLYHDPSVFQVLMQDDETARGRGRLSIVAPVEANVSANTIRFGLVNESSKINLIFAAELEDLEQAREMLMGLPLMDEYLADAILDWVDEDDEPREYGAESEHYDSLSPPIMMKPLTTLEELLLVRDVTAELLFGEDENRNGMLDPRENDGENPPFDNEDDILDLGWLPYLTLYSRETNRRADGSDRIFINQTDLRALHEELTQEFSEDEAQFIVAYLAYGPVEDPLSDTENAVADSGLSVDEAQALENAAQSMASALFATANGENPVTIDGLDISPGKQFTINSLYDLVDAEVEAQIDNSTQTLASPWTSDGSAMQSYLPVLNDALTTSDKEVIRGRIDINQARVEVLLGIPEMTEDLAERIARANAGPNGEPLGENLELRNTTGWLLIEGFAELTDLRALDQYITTDGDVHSAQLVGHFDEGGPQTRLQAVVDSTEYPAKVLHVRDISHLGVGYRPALLQQTTSPTN